MFEQSLYLSCLVLYCTFIIETWIFRDLYRCRTAVPRYASFIAAFVACRTAVPRYVSFIASLMGCRSRYVRANDWRVMGRRWWWTPSKGYVSGLAIVPAPACLPVVRSLYSS